ncbi:MAG: sugar transferase [Deltaproteobacteria bacterium]|nr:sugar transferase [Deltaproteobacteria bacterium]
MNPAIKTAVILGGGLAAFESFSIAACPKFLLPIANRPLFHYLAASLAGAGVERFIFCVTPNLGKQVEEKLAALPPSRQYLVKETRLGSGGSLKEVEALIKDEPFWVVGGDLLLAEDLSKMLDWHRERRALATVASLGGRESPWEMERVEVGASKQVMAIHRIHPFQERRSVLRPAGLYLCEPAILEAIPAGKYFDLKEQVFPSLYESGAPSAVWELQGYCRSITTIDDYLFANQDVLLGRVPIPETLQEFDGPPTPQPEVSPSCHFYGPVAIGEGVRFGDNVLVLGPSAIGPHCDLKPGTLINGCVLLGHNQIGRNAYLERCVVGEGTSLPEATIMHQTAIIKKDGEEASIWLRRQTRNESGSQVSQLGWLNPASKAYLRLKRLLDVIIAALGLSICAPLFVIIALAIRLDSPGQFIFRQVRCGKDGGQFGMYKFRSMVPEAEEVKRQIGYLNEADGPVFKINQDPRVTRVGKLLRNTNLDELPQLWNVLKGEMSLVGPRPLSTEEMRFSPRWRDARLSMRPGMTGLWQVKAHTKTQFNEWIVNDLTYVNEACFWLDVKILWKTALKSVANVLNLRKHREFQAHEI